MTAPQQLGTARTHDELVDLLAARKEALGLSNAHIEHLCNYAGGYVDKYLGPNRTKTLGRATIDDFLTVLCLKLVVVEAPELLAQMEHRFEERKPGYAHNPRVSRKAVQRAKPIVYEETGRLGGQVRAHLLTPKQRSQIAAKAARAKHRKARERSKRSAGRCGPRRPRHRGRDGSQIGPAERGCAQIQAPQA